MAIHRNAVRLIELAPDLIFEVGGPLATNNGREKINCYFNRYCHQNQCENIPIIDPPHKTDFYLRN